MLEYKKRILQKEFAFLNEVFSVYNESFEANGISLEVIEKIDIKKVDSNLLERGGTVSMGNFSYIYDRENYIDAKIFFSITDNAITLIPFNGRMDDGKTDHFFKAGTLGEELLKIEAAPEFIIELLVDERDDSFCYNKGDGYENLYSMIIYKAASFDIKKYHATKFQEAARELASEFER